MSGGFGFLFNEEGAVLAVLGALGGMVRTATLRTTWREGLRVVFIGSTLASGSGALGPYLLRLIIGDLPEGISTAFGVVAASAFVIGLVGITVVEYWIGRFGRPQSPPDGQGGGFDAGE